jgi:hypothetical protein
MEHVFDPKPNSPTSPSFPHAFSGNPGGIRTGPPIKTFGGDGLESPQFSKETQSAQSWSIFNKKFLLGVLRASAVNSLDVQFLRSVQVVDEAAVIDAPEIVEIPQRHRIGLFRGLVLFDRNLVDIGNRRDCRVRLGLQNHF